MFKGVCPWYISVDKFRHQEFPPNFPDHFERKNHQIFQHGICPAKIFRLRRHFLCFLCISLWSLGKKTIKFSSAKIVPCEIRLLRNQTQFILTQQSHLFCNFFLKPRWPGLQGKQKSPNFWLVLGGLWVFQVSTSLGRIFPDHFQLIFVCVLIWTFVLTIEPLGLLSDCTAFFLGGWAITLMRILPARGCEEQRSVGTNFPHF